MSVSTLLSKLDKSKYKTNELLKNYVPLGIGGPAEILYFSDNVDDLLSTVKLAKENDVKVTILGGGTNILISDDGIKGLVIVNQKGDIKIGESIEVGNNHKENEHLVSRWESDSSQGNFRGIEFKDLNYDESNLPRVTVTMDSGVSLEYAMYYLIEQGLTGLQWYSGIPGTIGGAIFNNIHGGTHFISEVLESVDVMDSKGNVKNITVEELGADYDRSRFHKTGEVIIRGYFKMYKGDKEKAKYVATEWAKRKRIQPRNSPGCVFGNITQEQKIKNNYPTTSTGYIVEFVINCVDLQIGGAKVYPDHHNFIINTGNATAKDYLAVIRTIYEKTLEKTGIKLVPEIFFLGFKPEELEFFTTDEHKEISKTRKREIKTVYTKRYN